LIDKPLQHVSIDIIGNESTAKIGGILLSPKVIGIKESSSLMFKHALAQHFYLRLIFII
jgi:hypothetical protein